MNPTKDMETTYPQIVHHGAANGVTGSCHRYIAKEDFHLLVDCGLFQGEDAGPDPLQQHKIQFDLSKVKALVITHVHIDHIGRLPYLIAAGFKNPIYCSIPSAHLIPLVIEDALKVGFTRDSKLIQQFLRSVGSLLRPLPYQQWQKVYSDPDTLLRVRLQRAGHILGSAYVELDLKTRFAARQNKTWQRHRTVFSGDLGAPHAPLLPAPKSPYGADTLVIESTYGNRLHESRRQRKARLRTVLDRALADRGTVMIPAFSIGRTQELLYELEALIYSAKHKSSLSTQAKSNLADLQVIVDSPLAAKFTEVYRALKPYWDKEASRLIRAGRHPLDFDNLITIDSHADHIATVNYLAQTKRPAIVLAASGMAAGGRIVNYLKAMLGDEQHNVLFVGYQAPGTPGYLIQKYAGKNDTTRLPWVELDGERYDIRCGVDTIGGYSAHADQKDLLNFVRRMRSWPKQIRIIHGSDEARESLRNAFIAMAIQHNKAGEQGFDIVLPVSCQT